MRRIASIVLVTGVLGLMLGLPAGLCAEEPAGKDWVGKKVVSKPRDFVLRSSDHGADFKARPGLYVVKEAKGSSLLVERSGVGGWVEADQVVPIDEATKFFAEVIRANPRDAFGYIMRANALIIDKKDFERAIADFDQAVRLDPRDALAYGCRGMGWGQKEEYDKAIADFDRAIRLDPKDASAYVGRAIVWLAKHKSQP